MGAPPGNQYWTFREKHGRDKDYANGEELLPVIIEYFQWCVDNPWYKNEVIKSGDRVGDIIQVPTARPFTLSGLCIHLVISETTWKTYRKNKDFLSVTNWAQTVIDTQQFEGAAVGVFQHQIIARKLGLIDKNETGYRDKDGNPMNPPAPVIVTQIFPESANDI